MDENQLKEGLKEQFETIENTLKTHVDDAMAQKYAKASEDISALREELGKKADAGENPASEKVADLEERLVEIESSVQDIVLKAESVAMGSKEDQLDRDAKLFKGIIARDGNVDNLRQALRAYHNNALVGGENAVRAIDSTLFTTGGKLSAETADRFLDFVTEQQVGLSRVTTRRMMSPEGHTDELTVSSRRLRKATEGTDPSVANAVGTKRRTMTTVEVIWAEDVTLSFLEDNIERRGAEAHIAQLLARSFGNDLEDLAWNGNLEADVSQDDAFLSINDGWIQLALEDSEVNDLDASTLSSPSNSDILSEANKLLPVEFRGVLDLGYFVPIPFAVKYAEELSDRQTSLGDQVMVNGFPVLRYFGWPVIATPKLYEDNVDRAVFTPISNLHHGVQRQITVDSEWQPRSRVVEWTITARNDYEYATGKGIVLISSIPSGNR